MKKNKKVEVMELFMQIRMKKEEDINEYKSIRVNKYIRMNKREWKWISIKGWIKENESEWVYKDE